MKSLEADIKNGIYKNLYLLAGKESYMRKRYENALIRIFLAEGDTMNLTRFFGKKTEVREIIEIADTMPFMAERRVIVLENTELFLHTCDELADYIPNIPDTTVIIFSEDKIDSRLKQVKAARSKGCIADFSQVTDEDIKNTVLSRLSKEHRQITRGALETFLARCPDDMWAVTNELEKIISYTFGKDGIREEDVKALMAEPCEDRIFAMIDAILAGDMHKALGFYRDLLMLRSDHIGIMGLIREQLRLLLHVKEMSEQRMSAKDMAAELGMREGRVKMALPAARKSSKIFLTEGIEMCADTEERIKTGLVNDQVGVETLIIELSSRKKTDV